MKQALVQLNTDTVKDHGMKLRNCSFAAMYPFTATFYTPVRDYSFFSLCEIEDLSHYAALYILELLI